MSRRGERHESIQSGQCVTNDLFDFDATSAKANQNQKHNHEKETIPTDARLGGNCLGSIETRRCTCSRKRGWTANYRRRFNREMGRRSGSTSGENPTKRQKGIRSPVFQRSGKMEGHLSF